MFGKKVQGRKSTLKSAMPTETFANNKWPVRMLSLIHPFNIDIAVDEKLEETFGLVLPFLDFRIGVQGADESFSFVISKEDEEYHSERNNVAKILRLLKMSKYKREQLDKINL